MQAIDGALLALTLGATFVARSFSGDKAQLVPIIQAGLATAALPSSIAEWSNKAIAPARAAWAVSENCLGWC